MLVLILLPFTVNAAKWPLNGCWIRIQVGNLGDLPSKSYSAAQNMTTPLSVLQRGPAGCQASRNSFLIVIYFTSSMVIKSAAAPKTTELIWTWGTAPLFPIPLSVPCAKTSGREERESGIFKQRIPIKFPDGFWRRAWPGSGARSSTTTRSAEATQVTSPG